MSQEVAVDTGIQATAPSNDDRTPRWSRTQRAALFDPSLALHAQGLSLRQAAKVLAVPRRTLQAWRAYHESLDEHPAGVVFFHSSPGLAFLPRLVLGIPVVCTAVGACGMRLGCLLLRRTGRDRFVAASYGIQQQVNRQVEAAMVRDRHEDSARLAKDMPAKAIPLTQDETCTGGLCLVAAAPKSHSIVLAQAAQGRDQQTWHTLMEQALSGLNGQVMQSTSDEAPGLLASVEPPLGAHHSPDVCHGPHERVTAVSGPMATTQRAAAKAAREGHERLAQGQGPLQAARDAPHKRGPGRPPQAAARLEQLDQAAQAAHQALARRSVQREPGARSLRHLGQASHVVDVERGGRRTGRLLAADIHPQLDTMRRVAQREGRSQTCLERSDKAQRVVPNMQATSECVSGSVHQQVRPLALSPPVSHALHASLMPSFSLERVAQSRMVHAGEPLREWAERLRTPLFEPGGGLARLHEGQQSERKQQAKELAEVCQRSSANVEGSNGSLSLRNPQLRGLDRPRKRAWLTAVHHFFLTRADGTTAAERFFGQKPRSMFVAIWQSVDLPPAPLSPPRRAEG
jgi:hypothetical protein